MFFVYVPEGIKQSMYKTNESLLEFDTKPLFWNMIPA